MSAGLARADAGARPPVPIAPAGPLLGGAALVFVSAFAWQFAGFLFNSVGAHTSAPRGRRARGDDRAAGAAGPGDVAVQAVASRETTGILSRGVDGQLHSMTRRYAGGPASRPS